MKKMEDSTQRKPDESHTRDTRGTQERACNRKQNNERIPRKRSYQFSSFKMQFVQFEIIKDYLKFHSTFKLISAFLNQTEKDYLLSYSGHFEKYFDEHGYLSENWIALKQFFCRVSTF